LFIAQDVDTEDSGHLYPNFLFHNFTMVTISSKPRDRVNHSQEPTDSRHTAPAAGTDYYVVHMAIDAWWLLFSVRGTDSWICSRLQWNELCSSILHLFDVCSAVASMIHRADD